MALTPTTPVISPFTLPPEKFNTPELPETKLIGILIVPPAFTVISPRFCKTAEPVLKILPPLLTIIVPTVLVVGLLLVEALFTA